MLLNIILIRKLSPSYHEVYMHKLFLDKSGMKTTCFIRNYMHKLLINSSIMHVVISLYFQYAVQVVISANLSMKIYIHGNFSWYCKTGEIFIE